MNILEINTDIDLSSLSSRVLRNEKKILKNYPPTDYFKRITDGETGLGTNSLTTRTITKETSCTDNSNDI